MKIVHLLGWYFPESVGGTEVYVDALCQRLRTAGIDVAVAAPDTSRGERWTYAHNGIEVFRYPIPKSPTRDEACHRIPVRGADVFAHWLAEQHADVLHVHSLTTGVSIHEIAAAKRLGVRVIMTSHLPGQGYLCRAGELMRWGRVPCDGIVLAAKCAACNMTRIGVPQALATICGSVPAPVSDVLGRLPGRAGTVLGMPASVVEYRRLQRRLFELVDRFVVLNETARQMLIADGSPADKLTLNRLGLSQRVAPKPPPDRQPTRAPVRFAFVGRLHPTKGLTALAAAVAAIPPSVRFSLTICGPDGDALTRGYADHIRAELAGDRRVTFVDPRPAAEIPHLLAEADVLLVPSIWFENGPTIALEAMAVGTPIIATAVGNLTELVQDRANGRVVAPGDAEALASAMTEAALDPAKTIDSWRRRILPPRTMDEVTRDYLPLYAA